jgi:hypothetical protein
MSPQCIVTQIIVDLLTVILGHSGDARSAALLSACTGATPAYREFCLRC